MTTCECSSCEGGIILMNHCIDDDGNELHSCASLSLGGPNRDTNTSFVSVEFGDPRNDQMLAMTREFLNGLLDVTIHPLIDQAEAQAADLSATMAALVTNWIGREEYMPRERLASLLALALFLIAAEEREVVADGKSVRRG